MAVLTRRHRTAASECRTAEMAQQRTKAVHRAIGGRETVSVAPVRSSEREFLRHFRRLRRTIKRAKLLKLNTKDTGGADSSRTVDMTRFLTPGHGGRISRDFWKFGLWQRSCPELHGSTSRSIRHSSPASRMNK